MSTSTLWIVDKRIPDTVVFVDSSSDTVRARFEERQTCRSTTPDDAWCFACSECGKSFPRHELHLAHNHGEINYCPNCGARVERREQ